MRLLQSGTSDSIFAVYPKLVLFPSHREMAINISYPMGVMETQIVAENSLKTICLDVSKEGMQPSVDVSHQVYLAGIIWAIRFKSFS